MNHLEQLSSATVVDRFINPNIDQLGAAHFIDGSAYTTMPDTYQHKLFQLCVGEHQGVRVRKDIGKSNMRRDEIVVKQRLDFPCDGGSLRNTGVDAQAGRLVAVCQGAVYFKANERLLECALDDVPFQGARLSRNGHWCALTTAADQLRVVSVDRPETTCASFNLPLGDNAKGAACVEWAPERNDALLNVSRQTSMCTFDVRARRKVVEHNYGLGYSVVGTEISCASPNMLAVALTKDSGAPPSGAIVRIFDLRMPGYALNSYDGITAAAWNPRKSNQLALANTAGRIWIGNATEHFQRATMRFETPTKAPQRPLHGNRAGTASATGATGNNADESIGVMQWSATGERLAALYMQHFIDRPPICRLARLLMSGATMCEEASRKMGSANVMLVDKTLDDVWVLDPSVEILYRLNMFPPSHTAAGHGCAQRAPRRSGERHGLQSFNIR